MRTGQWESVEEDFGVTAGKAAKLKRRAAKTRGGGLHAGTSELVEQVGEVAGRDREAFFDFDVGNNLNP